MNPHDQLITYLEKKVSLTEEQKQLVYEKFRLRRFKRRAFVYNEGDVHKYNNFVVSGALRLYAFDDSFREYSLHFAFENWWTGDLTSFVKGTPSPLCLQAFEDTVILQISYKDQLDWLDRTPKLFKPWMLAYQGALMRSNKRVLDNIGSTAEARYDDFIATYPSYVNRLPDKFIASYIGVTPEFYSKLKKNKLKKYLNVG